MKGAAYVFSSHHIRTIFGYCSDDIRMGFGWASDKPGKSQHWQRMRSARIWDACIRRTCGEHPNNKRKECEERANMGQSKGYAKKGLHDTGKQGGRSWKAGVEIVDVWGGRR